MADSSGKGDRRRAPGSGRLDIWKRRSYKGKLIKQRIERNRLSHVKKKFFKTLNRDKPEPGTYFKGLVNTSGSNVGNKAAIAENRSGDELLRDSDEQGGIGTSADEKEEEHEQEQEEEEEEESEKESARPPKRQRKPRANPFQKVMKVREQEKERRDEARKQRDVEIKQTEARRNRYNHDRKVQKKKFSAKTRRGQPVLSNQIDYLLKRIKKE
ncbi:hypothetical protein GGI12_002711 [Dipsacomyces acuminosporus]|nr:hypothetical protein GGI12_002711 [Dipsacomyces acuminosporus]